MPKSIHSFRHTFITRYSMEESAFFFIVELFHILDDSFLAGRVRIAVADNSESWMISCDSHIGFYTNVNVL